MLTGVLFGVSLLLVAQTTNSLTVEPGKQLPQMLTLEVANEGQPNSVQIPFWLFVPESYQAKGKAMPLLLFLHGYGESGDGTNLELVKVHGPPGFVDRRGDFPFIVVSPQCPRPESLEEIRAAWKPDQLIKLIDHLQSELNIDRDRIYVTGLSMGGYGTWRLVANYPDRFAAAIAICGGGDPETANALAEVPIWAFHGGRDRVVPPERSQEMVDAVRAAGGDIRLTIYMEAGHDSWSQTYANDAIYDWLLSYPRE